MHFSERLRRCQRAAGMTVADLTRWFDRPRPTVNTWLQGRTPAGPAGKCAEADLERLEKVVQGGWKIPPRLGLAERANFVREKRDGGKRNSRVSKVRASV